MCRLRLVLCYLSCTLGSCVAGLSCLNLLTQAQQQLPLTLTPAAGRALPAARQQTTARRTGEQPGRLPGWRQHPVPRSGSAERGGRERDSGLLHPEDSVQPEPGLPVLPLHVRPCGLSCCLLCPGPAVTSCFSYMRDHLTCSSLLCACQPAHCLSRHLLTPAAACAGSHV